MNEGLSADGGGLSVQNCTVALRNYATAKMTRPPTRAASLLRHRGDDLAAVTLEGQQLGWK